MDHQSQMIVIVVAVVDDVNSYYAKYRPISFSCNHF